ncbi:MAG TPA: hypothetical protein VNJ01_04835 [Bacteriovoracaceae bacterium]|nr:hypothetical protein [Bacteriovoracaceae bacterium]
MKLLLPVIAFLTLTQISHAAGVSTSSCEDFGVTLNSVYSMKTYAQGSVKVFEVDLEEPASGSVGIAVAITRGEDLSSMETFCRFIPGLSSAKLSAVKSKYSAATDTLTLTMPASKTNELGVRMPKVLTVLIKKGAVAESDLVTAVLK